MNTLLFYISETVAPNLMLIEAVSLAVLFVVITIIYGSPPEEDL